MEAPSPVALLCAALLWVAPIGCGGLGVRAHQPPLPPGVRPTPASLCPAADPETFCLPARRVAEALRAAPLEILQAEEVEGGISSPVRLLLRARPPGAHEAPLVFHAKWKAASCFGEVLNNSPRRELAAWQMQQLFLPPEDHVVPPTVLRCLPERQHDRFVTGAEPQVAGTDCVLGVLMYWVHDVAPLAEIDPERWQADPDYRAALANLNVLTFLIDFGDNKEGNILFSSDPNRPRALLVDAGLSFGTLENPVLHLLPLDWGAIVVPSLPRALVERLERIDRAEFDRRLSVVAQFEKRGDALVPVPPSPFPGDAFDGWEMVDGVIYVGLTREERDDAWERLVALLRRVHEGGLAVR